MKLVRVDLRMFRRWKHLSIEFPDKGWLRIYGANGVGKSAIVEALEWALTGNLWEPIKKVKRKAPGADPDEGPSTCCVIEHAETKYSIHRAEGIASVCDEHNSELADGVSQVRNLVADRLGTDRSELLASAICRQRNVTRFAAMTPKERRALVRRMLGTAEAPSAQSLEADHVSANLVLLKEEAKEANKTRRTKMGERNAAKDEEDDARSNWVDSQAELGRFHDQLEDAVERAAKLEQEVNDLELRKADIDGHLQDCLAQVRDLTEAKRRVRAWNPSRLNVKSRDLDTAVQRREQCRAELLDAMCSRSRDEGAAVARATRYADEIAIISEGLARRICPTCGKKLWRKGETPLREKRWDALANKKSCEELARAMGAPSANEGELRNRLNAADSRVGEIRVMIGELLREQGYCDAARQLIQHAESAGHKANQLREKLSRVRDQVARRKIACRDARSQEADVRRRVEGLKRRVESDRRDWDQKRSTFDLALRSSDLASEAHRRKQDEVQRATEALVDPGMRPQDARARFQHEIQRILNALLETPGPESQFEVAVDEDCKPVLLRKVGDTSKVAVRKGGLSALLGLATRVALLELWAKRESTVAGSDGVLILDEPFANVERKWRRRVRQCLLKNTEYVRQVVEICCDGPGTEDVYYHRVELKRNVPPVASIRCRPPDAEQRQDANADGVVYWTKPGGTEPGNKRGPDVSPTAK